MRRTSIVGILGVVCLAAPGWAQNDLPQLPPHPAVVPVKLAVPPPELVNSHILFLNNCRPSGCPIVRDLAGDDSRTNHSQIAPHSGTLGALSASIDFASIKSCMATALSPFNITVTDVDPGPNTQHFEIIIAGKPTEVGFDAAFEGVAPYLCSAPGQCDGSYIPNAITFAFANAYPDATLMCGVGLQESAHGWTLDHSTIANDPMTYKTYVSPLTFHNAAPCGSDCQYSCPGGTGVCNSFGVVCAGTGTTGTHMCMENNAPTQNESDIILGLFGPAGAVAPTLSITSPTNGAGEQIGTAFGVTATCSSADGIKEIDMYVDDNAIGMSTTSPASFVAPKTLAAGPHHIEIICGTTKEAIATAKVDVILGNTCAVDTDCGGNGQICYQMACIAGQNAVGGLGATCVGNGDCASGQCGNDGTQSLCVIPCDPTMSSCPAGFGCLDDGTGTGTGVCWLGADSSSGGCCETGHGDSRGSILFGLGFAAVWITRGRARKARN
jgi:Bacterial Ig domain